MKTIESWSKQIQKDQVLKLAHTIAKQVIDEFRDMPGSKGTSYFHSLSSRATSIKNIETLIAEESKRKSVKKYWDKTNDNEVTFYEYFYEIVTTLESDLKSNVTRFNQLAQKDRDELYIMLFQEICNFIAHYYWYNYKKLEAVKDENN